MNTTRRQFQKFISVENFKLAFKRLQTYPSDYYKELYRDDMTAFGLNLDENVHSLTQEIIQNIYSPKKTYKIYIPKKNGLVRPITVLNFFDLLCYQSLVNIIADNIYDTIHPLQNKVIFGSNYITTNDKDNIYFMRPWKQQWKNFNELCKKYYNDGFIYLTEFDLSSFYDTIDHSILSYRLSLLGIEQEITSFLVKLLKSWTCDHDRVCHYATHGIPQGPTASSLIANVYLLYIDLDMAERSLGPGSDIRYLRYVDDIKIFSKSEFEGKKSLAYLDLRTRDIYLIAQSSKISVKKVDNIDLELNIQGNKLSKIDHEYRAKGNTLKSKSHNRLKGMLLSSDSKSPQNVNKTIFSFSLYRLNADEEIKTFLLSNNELLYNNAEAFLYYLNRHYQDDPQVAQFLLNLLSGDNVLYKYIHACILRYFYHLPFSRQVYDKLTTPLNLHWYTSVYLIKWLSYNNKTYLISNLAESNDYIRKEKIKISYKSLTDDHEIEIFTRNLLRESNAIFALLPFLLVGPATYFLDYESENQLNSYASYILLNKQTDFINHVLTNDFKIQGSSFFFSPEKWHDKNNYTELCETFYTFYKYKEIDASVSIINLNNFNHLIFIHFAALHSEQIDPTEFGNELSKAKCLNDFLYVKSTFTHINNVRNNRSYAHPLDKSGKVRVKITFAELNQLIINEIKSLNELVKWAHDSK